MYWCLVQIDFSRPESPRVCIYIVPFILTQHFHIHSRTLMQTRTAVCPVQATRWHHHGTYFLYLYLLKAMCYPCVGWCWMVGKIKGITVFRRRKEKIETWLLSKEIIRYLKMNCLTCLTKHFQGYTDELFPGTWLKRQDEIGLFGCCCCWENYSLTFLRSLMTSVFVLSISLTGMSHFPIDGLVLECHGWIRSRQ